MEVSDSLLFYTFLLLAITSYLVAMRNLSKRRMRKPQQQGLEEEEEEEEKKKKLLKLPPGSMGWPYIGETPQLYSQDPNIFFATKQKRYGEVFKTHLLGCPCVMLASPEAARFVLVTQAHLFKPTYPRSKERMIGPWALFFHQGDYHVRLRRLVQSSLTPEALRRRVAGIEAAAVAMLESWDGREVKTFHEMKKFSFDVGILIIFGGRLEERHKTELKKNYSVLDKGYNSFPNIIPGTLHQKAVQARKKLRRILSEIMTQRRSSSAGVDVGNDLLGFLMASKDDKGEPPSDDQIADNVIGVLFAAQDTTASVLTWIVKYLHDNPKLLEAVKAEQSKILETNEYGKMPLTWAHTRNMVFTHRVILETLRMASIISFTFREAVADVEYQGYIIPKGWKVMPLFRNIHHNPEFFSNPMEFDPSRFEAAPKPNTFLPFGNGVHACPGNELAKLEIFILIHHLVTKYRWQACEPRNEVEYGPFPIPKNGFPAKYWRVSTEASDIRPPDDDDRDNSAISHY